MLKENTWLSLISLAVSIGFLTACTSISSEIDRPLVNPEIILATTTSTYDSGLLDELIPVFESETGYTVKIIAVGTGKALSMGEEGNADVLLVHAPASEKEFMENNYGIERYLVMHNDFVIVGPPEDLGQIRGISSPVTALAKIASAQTTFISRGDDSGTHKKERSIWDRADRQPQGDWYLESGQGMGATLRIASEKEAYTLTDRSTFFAQRETLNLEIMVEDDPSLLNVYHVMIVNPDLWPDVNAQGAQALADFLVSPEGQEIIGSFGIEKFGQLLFVPDAGKTESELGLEP